MIAIGFALGYFLGLELESDTYRFEQQVKNLEEKINNFEGSDTAPIKISIGDDPMLGNPNAPISIIEFSDYECPFCARFYAQTLPLLKEEYIEKGEVNFIYRDFPIKNHKNAMSAAIASECADEQNKFWQYHDILFNKQSTWKGLEIDSAVSEFKQYASEINVDLEVFTSCLDSEKYLDEVNLDFADGRSYKISGTPTFFIGNEELGYTSLFGAKPFEDFQVIIEEKLNQ